MIRIFVTAFPLFGFKKHVWLPAQILYGEISTIFVHVRCRLDKMYNPIVCCVPLFACPIFQFESDSLKITKRDNIVTLRKSAMSIVN